MMSRRLCPQPYTEPGPVSDNFSSRPVQGHGNQCDRNAQERLRLVSMCHYLEHCRGRFHFSTGLSARYIFRCGSLFLYAHMTDHRGSRSQMKEGNEFGPRIAGRAGQRLCVFPSSRSYCWKRRTKTLRKGREGGNRLSRSPLSLVRSSIFCRPHWPDKGIYPVTLACHLVHPTWSIGNDLIVLVDGAGANYPTINFLADDHCEIISVNMHNYRRTWPRFNYCSCPEINKGSPGGFYCRTGRAGTLLMDDSVAWHCSTTDSCRVR
ncbi:hypothetical protein CEXT_252531 [Caerostris extrusa]|uniref:Uncharacterized protein n=1 Tax=Caerostris extrusa TaxID=172846 RepID=A0AAV4MWR1_CAEEX|nr:hypothetical protein CEXT_252531 [Caerostris extrusa]